MAWFDIPDSDDLSEEQREIYGFDLNTNLLINGAAGSGKTLLALYRAKQLENIGKSVLFVVYTNTLNEYVAMGAKQVGLNNTTIATIQDLSEEATGRRIGVFNKFTVDKCIEIAKHHNEFDHIILDEGQDFSVDIYSNLFKRLGTHFTICIDNKQRLYSEHNFSKNAITTIFENIVEKKLEFTYRNPRDILKLSIKYYRDQLNKTPAETKIRVYNETDGEVKIFKTNDEIATIRRLILQKDINTIGILLPRTKTVDYITKQLDDYGDVSFEKYHTNMRNFTVSFSNNEAKILPYWSSKGIQFDIVVIPFIDRSYTESNDNIFNSKWEDEKKALYVAMTRTQEKLFFIKTDNNHFPYENSLDGEFYEEIQINEDDTPTTDEGEFVFDNDDLPF